MQQLGWKYTSMIVDQRQLLYEVCISLGINQRI